MTAWIGVRSLGLYYLFGVLVPYTAMIIFFLGVLFRLVKWARIPNPFPIPTTAGQQKGLHWIKHARLDNPFTKGQAILRLLSEIFLFRSLFRNLSSRMENRKPELTFSSAKWLWLFAILFHYAFAVTVFRHLRFFTNPVPWPVKTAEALDGWLEVGIPEVLVSGVVLLLAVTLLLARRLLIPKLRYISLLNDYFPLFLLIGIAGTGALMRYVFGIDAAGAKELAMGLVSFTPFIPANMGPLFFVHLFLVCTLLAYFPFSKLMHAGGIFFSPTRTMPNNSRAAYHPNPWNYPVKFHTYQAYETEFHDKMVEAGIPLDETAPPLNGKD
ncbi:MAG: sulfate reduction electron transfer complex DsrMKJOP subunit DsrM [Deltaproteobacteria bacterium]|nr:sulfate reduction electron transfer complex DsrMKJOP subunit DsrM [Deltaproteobacteria bacterium]